MDVDVPKTSDMDGLVDAGVSLPASLPFSLSSASDRYILTQVGLRQLAFPAQWVAEILLVDRSQILVLPFYDPILLGIMHYRGQIVPLVAIWQVLAGTTAPTREILSVVQLSQEAGRLANVGIVVDRASDTRLRDQFPDTLFDSGSTQPESFQPEPDLQIFHAGLLSDHLWKPQRWQPFDKL